MSLFAYLIRRLLENRQGLLDLVETSAGQLVGHGDCGQKINKKTCLCVCVFQELQKRNSVCVCGSQGPSQTHCSIENKYLDVFTTLHCTSPGCVTAGSF